jgi:hypothetical protein
MKSFGAIAFAVLVATAWVAVMPTATAAPGTLTVVELYQSQGCSSCPPANTNVNSIADRPDILALSFAVTYWDRLGWRDTFAQAQFTKRQYDYASGLHHSNVYTPQVILNGRHDLNGINSGELVEAISSAGRVPSQALSLVNDTLQIAAGRVPAPADVWLVRYDRRAILVPISAGENSGRTLPHRNIVREFVRLGTWTGAPVSFRVAPASDPNFATAVLVQMQNGGPIVAAAKF